MVTVEEVRLEIIPLQQRGGPDSANHAANANREENTPVAPEKPSGDGYNWRRYEQRGSPDSANLAANANREENTPVVPEKPSGDGYNWQKYGQRGSPDSANYAAIPDREENSPVVPEKPSEDGYNWRKYGQKNIKGNKHIRSYYRCSYPKCLVKKQVERAPDGRITDTSYFGMHDHPKPLTGVGVAVPSILSVKVQAGDNRSSVLAEEKSSSAHALTADDEEIKETNEIALAPINVEGTHDIASPSSVTKDYGNSDDNVASKRRKTGDDYDMSMDKTPNSKSRWVVETVSAVDIVNDGYRWRKYGQKLVKDNPNARSYYRCTNPGCPAKKRVERASHDQKIVITTYEGHHDHDVPQGRTLLLHSSSPAANIASGYNGIKPADVIRAQSTAAIYKGLGNTIVHADEKVNTPEEVNRAQSSAAICKQEQGSADHPSEEVNRAQIGTSDKQQGDTIDHTAEKDSAAEEVKRVESSALICKQEQGNNTIDLPAKKDDPPEEVNRAENSVAICEQEEGNTIDHSAEKDDPPEEVDQAQSSATICKQEQGNATDHPPAEETSHLMI